MLRAGTLMLALAVASSFALPQIHNRSGDRVRDLVLATFDYLKASYAKQDPLSLPNMAWDSKYSHLEGLFQANLTLTNVMQSGMSNVLAENVKTDPKGLTAQLLVNFPDESYFAGDYQVAGEAAGQKVSGAGKFDIKTLNFTWSLNNVQLLETENKALRIQSLGLQVDIADILFSVEGLNIENMSLPDFEKVVDQSLHKNWDSFKLAYSMAAEINYIRTLNEAIGDRTLEEVIQWLKDNKGVNVAENFNSLLAMAETA